jgi:hypothetical protein
VGSIVSHAFERRFKAPRAKVWEAFADTARYNEFVGLPKHDIREEKQSDGSIRFFASARIGPVALAWEDIPQEWVHQQWFRHLRVFSKGPLKSLKVIARFEDTDDGGSVCRYSLEVVPKGLLGNLLLKLGFSRPLSATSTPPPSRWKAGPPASGSPPMRASRWSPTLITGQGSTTPSPASIPRVTAMDWGLSWLNGC